MAAAASSSAMPAASSASPSSCLGLSLAKWRDKQLDSFFRSCGLEQQSLHVDPETLISIWRPSKDALDPRKPALVLIQGFGTSPLWQWHHQVKPLHKHFRLFLPDLVFFGRSYTRMRHRSEVFQATMIAKALEILQVPEYNVVGTSYGGFVAYRLAHLVPERVGKVIIANSGVCKTSEDDKSLLARASVDSIPNLLLPLSPSTLRTLMSLSFLRPPPFLPSFLLNDIIQYFYIENREERVELLHGLALGSEGSESLPGLSQNVLIIWGDHDGIFPIHLAYRLQEHLGKNAELVIVENTAHCVQAEKPDEFNRLVQSFLLGSES